MIRLLPFILLFTTSCTLWQSSSQKSQLINLESDEYIMFQSGGCIGPCDVHKLWISKDGIKNYTLKKPHESAVSFYDTFESAENKQLWEMVEQVNWNSIDKNYGIRAEDITPKTLLIFTKAHNKRIDYKHGVPMTIINLENELMRIINESDWKNLDVH